jgi:hypothetical protein
LNDWQWLSLLLISTGPFFFFVGEARGKSEWDLKHRAFQVHRDAAYYRARRRYIAASRPLWTKICGHGSILVGAILLLVDN